MSKKELTLPEAQLDRFMFNTWVDYPTFDEELNVVKQTTSGGSQTVNAVIRGEEILAYQDVIRRMPVADNVVSYAVVGSYVLDETAPQQKSTSTSAGSRSARLAVPRRGGQSARALEGKYSPDIEDVQAVATPILRHRIVRNYKAEDGVTVEALIDRLK